MTVSNVLPPSIVGDHKLGATLRTDGGSWSSDIDAHISLTYQWERAAALGGVYSDIGGATGPTYTVVAADQAHALRCRVSAHEDTPGPSGSGGGSGTGGTPLFASDSPINTAIGGSPTVTHALGFIGSMGMGFNNGNAWSVAIFRDTTGTRRTMTGGSWHLDNVPKPAQFTPMWDAFNVANAEWHTIIVDSDRVFNIYKPNRDLTTFGAAGCFRPIDGAGTRSRGVWDANKGPWCGRASGFCSAFGAVLKSEWAAGSIPHALTCSWPKARIASSSPVAPAVVSDGSGVLGASGVVPMGTRLQLDPALTDSDLTTLGVPSDWLCVAHAMQTYGMFVAESSGGMSIYAECWNDSGRTTGWTSNGGITSGALVPHFRAVAPPAMPVLDDRTVFSQPHQ